MYRIFLSTFIMQLGLLLSSPAFTQALPDFTELVEKTAPAIVNVTIRSTVTGADPFEDFDGDREELEEFLGRRVHLFLQVKVRPNWLDEAERYSEMGLDFRDGN